MFFLLVLMAPIDPTRLAPTLPDLEQARLQASAALDDAAAASVAAARLQNQVAEGLASGRALCTDADLTALAARIGPFVSWHRDAAQRARLRAVDVQEYRTASTVAPLVGPGARADDDALLEQITREGRMQLELGAWNKKHLAALSKCRPTVQPAAGLGATQDRVAVHILTGVGCPGAIRPGVAVVPGAACVQDAGPCTCAPQPVSPGAAMGPGAPQAAQVEDVGTGVAKP